MQSRMLARASIHKRKKWSTPAQCINFGRFSFPHKSAAEKRGLWEGVVQEPLRRALFCVFLCSEVIFSCKSHRKFFQKLPLQCGHFVESPLAKNPKTQLLNKIPPNRQKWGPQNEFPGTTRTNEVAPNWGPFFCTSVSPINRHSVTKDFGNG